MFGGRGESQSRLTGCGQLTESTSDRPAAGSPGRLADDRRSGWPRAECIREATLLLLHHHVEFQQKGSSEW